MKWPEIITLLSIGLLAYLVYNNIGNVRENERLRIENDSMRKNNEILLEQNDSLDEIFEKLKAENDSLKFKKTEVIYNNTIYKYGKEVTRLDSTGVYGYLDILSK